MRRWSAVLLTFNRPRTFVIVPSMLLLGFGSGTTPVTLALLHRLPAASGCAMILILTLLPDLSVPRSHLSGIVLVHPPTF
jgi:hypothetical protein